MCCCQIRVRWAQFFFFFPLKSQPTLCGQVFAAKEDKSIAGFWSVAVGFLTNRWPFTALDFLFLFCGTFCACLILCGFWSLLAFLSLFPSVLSILTPKPHLQPPPFSFIIWRSLEPYITFLLLFARHTRALQTCPGSLFDFCCTYPGSCVTLPLVSI